MSSFSAKSLAIVCLACALAALASAQNGDNQNNQNNQVNPISPSSPTNPGDNELNLKPSNEVVPGGDSRDNDESAPIEGSDSSSLETTSVKPKPFDPLYMFNPRPPQPQPRPRPPHFGPSGPMMPLMPPFFQRLLGEDIFDSMRESREQLNKQFQLLERQAAEGQDVSYFSKNGVSYVRTCTTKRVQ